MKLRKIIAVAVGMCMLLSAAAFPAFGDEIPEGFSSWEEYYEYLVFGEAVTEETPELKNMQLVGSNDRLNMYYHENGADVYLEDKATGKVWGSAIYKDYIDTNGMSPNAASNLLTVSYSDENDSLLEADVTAASTDDFSVSAEYGDKAVTLAIAMPNTGISFNAVLSLADDGLQVNIPYDSVKDGEKHKLVSIRLLPLLGAAAPGEEGYIFYPDGSGALMNIADYRKSQSAFYNYPIYCTDDADFDVFDSNAAQDIKPMMLPVFGIKHTSGGILAEISSGAENAGLHISSDALYQTYFELFYRTNNTVLYEFASKASGEVNKIGLKRMEGDRTVAYHILEDKKNTYSDMAVLYRNLLTGRGELAKQEETDGVPLSVELFMGIAKSGIVGDTIQALTTYDDATKIVSDLYKKGVKDLDVLLKGWCEGGYDTLPTAAAAESKLGGQSELKKLIEMVERGNGDIYLLADLINADSDTGTFNAEKNALRNGLDSVITDDESVRYWLNPDIFMDSALDKLLKKQKSGSVCIAGAGSWLLSDVGTSNETTRAEMVTAIQNGLKKASKTGSVAVTGGNSYVWRYADRMFELPDNDSQYYQTDRTVPFYQMVVHGYKSYSSLAANLSYDYNYQKLRFVETGSIPHFVITENSPNLLQGTSFDDIFSSEYSDWQETVIDMWSEMNERLSDVWNLTIDSHEYLSDELVRIVYSDSSAVYINYSDSQVETNGVTVPAMDYVLVKGA